MKQGFDAEKYLEQQSKYILERVNNFDKLYIEFGGKLIGDLHAKRVLPGFGSLTLASALPSRTHQTAYAPRMPQAASLL